MIYGECKNMGLEIIMHKSEFSGATLIKEESGLFLSSKLREKPSPDVTYMETLVEKHLEGKIQYWAFSIDLSTFKSKGNPFLPLQLQREFEIAFRTIPALDGTVRGTMEKLREFTKKVTSFYFSKKTLCGFVPLGEEIRVFFISRDFSLTRSGLIAANILTAAGEKII